MAPRSPVLVVLVVVACLLAGGALRPNGPVRATAPQHEPAPRAGTVTFAPGTAPSDERLFVDAIAAVRPEARALIDRVAGGVEVRFGPTPEGTLGVTTSGPDHADVVIDLARTYRQLGPRGVARVVIHELGHVVDHQLVPEQTKARLDALIPAGYRPAPRQERFAETFAKWATGDIGAALYVGYAVPPPSVTLEAWAAPLLDLAR